jgi:hypothetical protein
MSTSSILTDYLGQGLAASRPASPPVAATALAYFYATDTGVLSLWDTATSAWVTVTSGTALTAVGTGLTITTPGTVALDTLGTGLSITSGTINAEWNAGTVGTLGSGLSLSSGTLSSSGGSGEWTAGTVTAVGAGLFVTSDTIEANWNGGTVTSLGSGLTLSSGTLSASGGGGTTLPFFNIAAGVPLLSSFTQVGIAGTTSIAQAGTQNVISIIDTGGNALDVRAIYKAAPSTPYRVAILVCDTPGIGASRGLIWGISDGTKYQMAYRFNNGSQYLVDWSTSTTEVSAPSLGQGPPMSPIWLGVHNDGTTIFWEVSSDGVNFAPVFSVAVGSAYCTPTYVAVGLSPQSDVSTSAISIQCYDPNGLTRSF